jgi:hypothetical protein
MLRHRHHEDSLAPGRPLALISPGWAGGGRGPCKAALCFELRMGLSSVRSI